MAALTVLIILGVLATIYHSQAQMLPKILERSSSHHTYSISEDVTIFENGKFEVTKPIKVGKSEFYAPEPLLVVSPQEPGSYPVLLFIHGTLISNEDYSDLFQHFASHGFIVVAPKLFSIIYFPSQEDEIEMAASIANWLPTNLQDVLQTRVNEGVEGDLYKLAISGHSRGGKSAFALALGFSQTKLSLKISALIGIDPVAGSSKNDRTQPYVLTYMSNSFNLSIPVTIIGTGYGNQSNFFLQPCAPNLVSHQQFFDECKEGSHFVITDYGHMQMLNDFVYDPVASAVSLVCKSGSGLKSTMRRTLGGIMVAFLDAYFGDEEGEYLAILANPSLAPTNLYVQNKGNFRFPGNYEQV
ncbi:chlorophyllase type 0-like [Chenopodium quinoa]|uniref:Chlorophyllase n=1 Tax=Chenopodium quinoa TaxID=63459 RepID=A0A803LQW8_CHEQI|nr:chlorophyllase type 0-like [Chenopodium quinoa]